MKKLEDQHERGDGSIYLRGKVYWIRYSRRGKEFRESSRSTNEAAARKMLDKRMKEIWAEKRGLQVFAPKAEKLFVDDLLDNLESAYKAGGRALPQFKSHLKPIREAFGDIRAVDVTAKRVDEYIEQRVDAGKAAGTVNRETAILGQAFSLARQRGELMVAPYIRSLPESNAREGFFEQSEFKAVVGNLPDYLKGFAWFGYLSGWRKGEIASLRWADVERQEKVIQLRGAHSKNGHARKLALEGELFDIIEQAWASREFDVAEGVTGISAFVFHRQGQPVGDFRKAWTSACKAAGLAGKLFHDLRRSAVRNMVRAGVREGIAMAISGHRTRSIFDRYNISSEEDLRAAVLRTQAHLEAQPTERKVVSIN